MSHAHWVNDNEHERQKSLLPFQAGIQAKHQNGCLCGRESPTQTKRYSLNTLNIIVNGGTRRPRKKSPLGRELQSSIITSFLEHLLCVPLLFTNSASFRSHRDLRGRGGHVLDQEPEALCPGSRSGSWGSGDLKPVPWCYSGGGLGGKSFRIF